VCVCVVLLLQKIMSYLLDEPADSHVSSAVFFYNQLGIFFEICTFFVCRNVGNVRNLLKYVLKLGVMVVCVHLCRVAGNSV